MDLRILNCAVDSNIWIIISNFFGKCFFFQKIFEFQVCCFKRHPAMNKVWSMGISSTKSFEFLRVWGLGDLFSVWLPSCYQWWVGKEKSEILYEKKNYCHIKSPYSKNILKSMQWKSHIKFMKLTLSFKFSFMNKYHLCLFYF